MMLNTNRQVVEVPPHVHAFDSKGRPNAAAIAVLAPLREVLEPSTGKCGAMFKLETRARIRQ